MATVCGFGGVWSVWLMVYTGVVMGVDGDECGGTGWLVINGLVSDPVGEMWWWWCGDETLPCLMN